MMSSALIYLRDHEEKDFEDVLEINLDPLVKTYLGGIKSKEEVKSGFDFVLNNYRRFKFPLRAIVHIEEDKVIGYCGMPPLKNIGFEIYFGLNSKYWGNGFCQQAVRQYLENEAKELETVYATVHPENIRSKRVLERVGFAFERIIFYEPQKMDHELHCRIRMEKD